MSDPTQTIAVVGGGPAATLAVRTIAAEGQSPLWFRPSSPGLTGVWTGIGRAFGPETPLLSASAGAVESRMPHRPELRRHRADRWASLMERRGRYHPYSRMGLGVSEVDANLDDALELLPDGLLGRCDDGVIYPGPHGQPATPDLLFPSITPLKMRAGDQIVVVDAPGLNGWDARALAEQIGRADGLATDVALPSAFDDLPPGHGVGVARAFREAWEADADAIADQLRQTAEEKAADLIVLPPVLAATLDEHRPIWQRLRRELDVRLAEAPIARDPVFGWRLDRALRALADSDVVQRPCRRLHLEERRIVAVEDTDETVHEVDAVIIATGRWVDGGRPKGSSMVEPLTGTPLWLDGEPMADEPELYPPDFLGRLPWSDHELFRVGVAIDRQLRLLDRDGAAAFDNAFAAGRTLAGFNPTHDGCALGIDLVSGRLAGLNAIAALPEASE